MLNACQELVQLIQKQGRKWQKAIQFERDARIRMERMCEEVASQSAKLEKRIQRASRKDKDLVKSPDRRNSNEDSLSSDSDEFHDAESVFRIPYVKSLFESFIFYFIRFLLNISLDFNIMQLVVIIKEEILWMMMLVHIVMKMKVNQRNKMKKIYLL